MFAYILYAPNDSATEQQAEDFMRRFAQTPGLVHAFELVPADSSTDTAVVAIWENKEAAEAYLNSSPLRKEVDQTIPQVRRVMYDDVRVHK